MGDRLVAIHQPNFFPWLGFFDKLARADVFILMDNAQFQKKGGCWTNRVMMRVSGEARWVTAPVDRSYHGTLPIAAIVTADSPWREQLVRTLEASYGRAPFFTDVMPMVSELVLHPDPNLAAYNIHAITRLADVLGLDPSKKLVNGSDLGVDGKATDLLVEMVRAVDGTAYLCGGGASGYQEDEKFAAAGLELVHQDFRHPVYTQHNVDGFAQGLSVLDALFECGFDGTRRLLRERPA